MLARLGPEADDPLDELLAAALAYERSHGPSLQGFLHWLGAGDIEVKRDLDQRGRDEVRIMTVHGAKGLQAPIVFLPDTLQVPTPGAARVCGPTTGCRCGGATRRAARRRSIAARAAARRGGDEEYRRLLYVAMTRAEDRLYVCGWRTQAEAAAGGCWYDLVAAGWRAAAPKGSSVRVRGARSARRLGGTRACVSARRRRAKPRERTRLPTRPPLRTALAGLGERRRPSPSRSPPKPLAPSRPQGAEPAPRSPLGGDERRGLPPRAARPSPAAKPAAARRRRRARRAARRFLALPVHGARAGGAGGDPRRDAGGAGRSRNSRRCSAPGSLAEVPVVGLIGGRAISGRIDRLVVTDDAVLIVDYKTLRPVPASEAEIPPLYLDQLRAYRAAMAAIYPGRAVQLRAACGPTGRRSCRSAMPPRPAAAIDARRA